MVVCNGAAAVKLKFNWVTALVCARAHTRTERSLAPSSLVCWNLSFSFAFHFPSSSFMLERSADWLTTLGRDAKEKKMFTFRSPIRRCEHIFLSPKWREIVLRRQTEDWGTICARHAMSVWQIAVAPQRLAWSRKKKKRKMECRPVAIRNANKLMYLQCRRRRNRQLMIASIQCEPKQLWLSAICTPSRNERPTFAAAPHWCRRRLFLSAPATPRLPLHRFWSFFFLHWCPGAVYIHCSFSSETQLELEFNSIFPTAAKL